MSIRKPRSKKTAIKEAKVSNRREIQALTDELKAFDVEALKLQLSLPPRQSLTVAIHYDAYLPNGTMWDSSRKRGRPLRFRLGVNQVIKGLDETVMQMSMGMRARVTIPSTLAYGERGFPGLVPPNTAIDFDLELLEIV